MKVIFMGAPDFAVPALDALGELGVEIAAVYTKAPRPGGRRGLEVTKTPVHLRAEQLGLSVLTPGSLRGEQAQAEFSSFGADAAVVAAYGLILPGPVLAAPRLGCVNLHGSLLPRWKGAAPIQRAIMAGDTVTGVGLMRMEEGLDTGPVAREARLAIQPGDTAGDVTVKLAQLAAQLLKDCWTEFADARLPFLPQPDEGVIYARKIEKAEALIDWSRDCLSVRNQIHALSPAPGAYSETSTSSGSRERLKFLRVETHYSRGEPGEVLDGELTVACGSGSIRAKIAQRAGKTPMSGAEIMRSGWLSVGDRLGVVG